MDVAEVLGTKILIAGALPALYVREDDALVVADIHLGFEEVMASQGIMLYHMQLRDALRVLREAKSLSGARRLIVNGDIKHAFEKLTRQERKEIPMLFSGALEMGFKEIIVVRGNHDNYVAPLVRDHGAVFVEDALELGGGITVTHGHQKVETGGELIIMGHEHPAVQLTFGGYRTKYRALLLMPTDIGKTLIIEPAMGKYQVSNPAGLDRGSYLSPIINEHGLPEEALPVLVEENIGVFTLPRLKELYSRT